jgi:Raf kinase inhibitor-like YbhB/YbcL family protein
MTAAMIYPASAADFTLTSPSIADGQVLPPQHVFNSFGCTGGNQSPELSWTNPPEGTKSFAVTVYDPDAPTGSGWWHWVVFDLPASVSKLPADAGSGTGLPEKAIQSRTDFGKPGFGGACPPPGHPAHRYIFTVHALKVDTLGAGADASGAMAGYFINMNSLGKASFTATYGR